jgi:hypothetical protein
MKNWLLTPGTRATPGQFSQALKPLRRGALDVRRPRTLRAVGDLELDSITLAQICDALAIDSTLVKEIFLARLTLDEPKAFVHSQRPNCSCHLSISDLWFLTIAVDFNLTDGMTCLVEPDRRSTSVADS